MASVHGRVSLATDGDSVHDRRENELRIELEDVRRQRLALEKKIRIKTDGQVRLQDREDPWLTALNAQPVTDPFACLCRCKLEKIGQSYILYERKRKTGATRDLIIVGPHWIGVVITLAIILGCTALFLSQQCTLMPWYYTLYTLAFCSATLYYLYGVACKDPGIVLPASLRRPKKAPVKDTTVIIDDDDEDVALVVAASVSDDAHDSDSDLETGAGSSRARARTMRAAAGPTMALPSRSRLHRPRFCDVCELPQDADTEHCDDCGVCIEDYDHHCPWMGKCIGKHNMHAFKMFNLLWVLYVIFVLFVSIQNVDWGTIAVQRLHRLSTGEWVPVGTTTRPGHF